MAANRQAAPAASTAQYLNFMLGEATYAIAILGIKEVIQYGGVTEVPRMPDFIRGVINLRGAVLPVIDLGACFGRGVSAPARRSCIVVMEMAGGHEVGVMVDAVHAVLDIDTADIGPPPAFGGGLRADFIQGMARVGERVVVILDVGAALSQDQVAALDRLATTAAGA